MTTRWFLIVHSFGHLMVIDECPTWRHCQQALEIHGEQFGELMERIPKVQGVEYARWATCRTEMVLQEAPDTPIIDARNIGQRTCRNLTIILGPDAQPPSKLLPFVGKVYHSKEPTIEKRGWRRWWQSLVGK